MLAGDKIMLSTPITLRSIRRFEGCIEAQLSEQPEFLSSSEGTDDRYSDVTDQTEDPIDFVAVDVETANCDRASICQIGIAAFRNGRIADRWQSLVNPDDDFDPFNVTIHGIDEDAVKNAPTFAEIAGELNDRLSRRIVVSHSPFDRVALARAAEKCDLPEIQCRWLDSAKVARRAWQDCAHRGYGLKAVAEMLGIAFNHHNAQDDAMVAGEILLHAQETTGLTVRDWLDRVRQPINPSVRSSSSSPKERAVVNPDGHLFGEVIVFTGTLTLFTKPQAKQLAAAVGCEPKVKVSGKTTMVVIGAQDVRKFAGRDKSDNHQTAEELIAKGHRLQILTEADFIRLVEVPR